MSHSFPAGDRAKVAMLVILTWILPAVASWETTRPAVAQSPGSNTRQKAAETVNVYAFIIDNSGSMSPQNKKQANDAFVAADVLTGLLELSPKPNKVWAAVFNSATPTKVIGDGQEMPTAEFDQFRVDLLKVATDFRPQGETPTDKVYKRFLSMVEKLPDNHRVTLIQITDGLPRDSIRRELVADLLRAKTEAIQQLKLPANVERSRIARLEDPRTPEGKKILVEQDKRLFARCEALVENMHTQGVRVVTLALQDNKQLYQLHSLAGSLEDYLVVNQADRIADKLLHTNLVNLPRVLEGAIIRREALKEGEDSFPLPVGNICGASHHILIFDQAIADLDKHWQITATADGRQFTFDESNADPNALVCRDAAGNAKALVLKLDSAPADGKVEFHFQSADQTVPAMQIHRHFRLDDRVRGFFRPVDSSITTAVNASPHPRHWHASLMDDQGAPIGVRDIQVYLTPVFGNARNPVPVRMQPVPTDEFPDGDGGLLFESAEKPQLRPGQYTGTLNIHSLNGLQFKLPVGPINIVDKQVTLKLTVPEASVKEGRLWLAKEIGDGEQSTSIALEITPQGNDFSLPIEVRVDREQALEGTKLPISVEAKFNRSKSSVQPGGSLRVTLTARMNGKEDIKVQDGKYCIPIKIIRTDTGEELPIELSDFDHLVPEPTHFWLNLRQARVIARIRKAGCWVVDTSRQREQVHRTNVNIALPFRSSIVVHLHNKSVNERRLRAPSKIKLFGTRQDTQQRPYPQVRFELREGQEAIRTVAADGSAAFVYDVILPDKVDFDRIRGQGVFTGSGVVPATVTFDVAVGKHLYAKELMYGLGAFALVLAWPALRTFRRYRYARGLRKDATFSVTSDRPLKGAPNRELVSATTIGMDQPALVPDEDFEVETRCGDGETYLPAVGIVPVKDASVTAPIDVQLFNDREDESLAVEFKVEGARVVDDEAEADLVVTKAPEFSRQATRLWWFFLALVVVLIAFGYSALQIENHSVYSRLQWLCDAAHLWIPFLTS